MSVILIIHLLFCAAICVHQALAQEEEDIYFQVSLEYKETHLCGGSIIDYKWILTSASCVADRNKEDLLVKAPLAELPENGDMQDRKLANGYVKPTKQRDYTSNDIAMLELIVPFKEARYVETIPIAKKFNILDGDKTDFYCRSRFGKKFIGLHNKLRKISCPHTSFESRADRIFRNDYDDLICVEISREEHNSFIRWYDGFGLVFNGKLVGVFSWSVADKPSNVKRWIYVFTKIEKHLPFILYHVPKIFANYGEENEEETDSTPKSIICGWMKC